MKRYLIAAALLMLALSINAQTMKNTDDLATRIKLIEDRIALKELVDVFSNLADQKETEEQTFLFTENATVETLVNGQPAGELVGRKQIADAFANFLKNFEVVYHSNGQQTVTITGDRASGTSYCLVVLIGSENGKKMKTTMGVYYYDQYVRENGKWLIAKRQSTFAWREHAEISQ